LLLSKPLVRQRTKCGSTSGKALGEAIKNVIVEMSKGEAQALFQKLVKAVPERLNDVIRLSGKFLPDRWNVPEIKS
jgi:hypothetical protein